MNELTAHPNVYSTSRSTGLISLLERMWVRENTPGNGTLFIISGFANYNGGVRFFETFREHVRLGGKIAALFSGSSNARLTSKQVVREMLECGADVHIVNRKRLLHIKCYGSNNLHGDSVVVSSGNFTGPGMSQNVEMSVLLDPTTTAQMNFSWDGLINSTMAQRWEFYRPSLQDLTAPAWRLLYDEQAANIVLDETDRMTLILRLSHADTARFKLNLVQMPVKDLSIFGLVKADFFHR